jgi:thymidylate synthase (FAD)
MAFVPWFVEHRLRPSSPHARACLNSDSNPDLYVTTPQVYLLGRQMVVEEELARFLKDEGLVFTTDSRVAAEILNEVAGRTCYMSFGKGRKSNQEYLENILISKHGSVLEHAIWNLLITGVSRALTHELVRHRAGFGYSQLSQRYVDESEARYVVPPLYQDIPELREKWQRAIESLRAAYLELAEMTVQYVQEKHPEMAPRDRRKWARQAARSILPNACETKIFVTGNSRAWRHFLELRGSPHADTEIRILAVEICRVLKRESPNLFQDLELVNQSDGMPAVQVQHSKV